MRIIAGQLGGRLFHEPRGHHTHPMSEKVRGALFNTLGDIDGLTVLDAFAGSGALSFEAISRGAKQAVAIDKDAPAHRLIERNIRELDLGSKVSSVRASAGGWSDNNKSKQFNIILLDPPYDYLRFDLLQKIITRHLKDKGVAVLSLPGQESIPDFDGFKTVANKQHGDAQLAFYRKL